MNYKRVKGCLDYYPKEEAIRQAIFAKLREQAKRYGFREVSSPAIETSALLTAKSGDEVKEQLFNFEKKSKEEISLRFDLTVPLTRMFVTKGREMQKPAKWFAIDRMWRYEAPQKGRQREFYQLSVELFGSNKPESDADALNLAISCLKSFGLTKDDVVVKINNRKLLEGILLELVDKTDLEATIRIIDKSSKISLEEFKSELHSIGLGPEQRGAIVDLIALKGGISILKEVEEKFQLSDSAKEGLAELLATLQMVDVDFIEVDLSIARGLAYYTGNIYECFDKGGQYRALFGGGRYNELVGLFGGQDTPATGFGLGLATLSLLLEDKKLLPKTDFGPEYYVAPIGEKMLPEALKIVARLREKTTADIDLMGRKLGKQFDYANSIGAKKIVIVGAKDLQDGKVTVKDMKTGQEISILARDL